MCLWFCELLSIVTIERENSGRKLRECNKCRHRWNNFGLKPQAYKGTEFGAVNGPVYIPDTTFCRFCGESDCETHQMNFRSNDPSPWESKPEFQGILEDCARRRRAYKFGQ